MAEASPTKGPLTFEDVFLKGKTLLNLDDRQKLGGMFRHSNARPWDGAIHGILKTKPEIELLEKTLSEKSGDWDAIMQSVAILGDDFRSFSVSYPMQKKDNNFLGGEVREVSDFMSFEFSVMEKVLKRFDDGDGDQYLSNNTLRTASFMATTANLLGDNARAEIAVDFLLKHCDKANKGYFDRFPLFFSILECGNVNQIERGKKILVEALLQDSNLGKFAQEEITNQSANNPGLVKIGKRRQFLEGVFSLFGLNGEDILRVWDQTTYSREKWNYEDQFTINFKALVDLERERPGIGKSLQKEFGINDFGRYPKELLIDQYDSKDIEDSLPYGVIIYPQSDWNGAFYQQKEIFDNVFNQLKGKYRMKVWEISDALGLVRALNKSRNEFGPISFAIIGGHGTAKHIEFSRGEASGKELTKDHIKRKGASAMELAFTNNPTIILNSCSTGELQGIGENISKIGNKFPMWLGKAMSLIGLDKLLAGFKSTVIAPSKPTSIKNIDAKIGVDDKLDFEVEYADKDFSPQIYQSGILKN